MCLCGCVVDPGFALAPAKRGIWPTLGLCECATHKMHVFLRERMCVHVVLNCMQLHFLSATQCALNR